jgi:hypothetical protein
MMLKVPINGTRAGKGGVKAIVWQAIDLGGGAWLGKLCTSVPQVCVQEPGF